MKQNFEKTGKNYKNIALITRSGLCKKPHDVTAKRNGPRFRYPLTKLEGQNGHRNRNHSTIIMSLYS